MSTFRALRVFREWDGNCRPEIVTRSVAELPPDDLLIDVKYSSLNYKDALSATGAPGVTRDYPHTPGIDAVGSVLESNTDQYQIGDIVIVTGFRLGMDRDGGFGQRIRVPAHWAVRKPKGLSLNESMILGTAGLTAALCIEKLTKLGMSPDGGPVVVTGSTGGVGSCAIGLLSHLGYEVHAVTGKTIQQEFLRSLGAQVIYTREEFMEGSQRALLREAWGGVVDTVGGEMLMHAIKGLRYGCSAAACGLVSSPMFPGSVFPFILRNVNLLGVDSAETPTAERARIWERLASNWKFPQLDQLQSRYNLETVMSGIDKLMKGEMVGRGVVELVP
ncbi:MAG: YhdH/YhfP family quinone oxidoreductase [Gammaproteobacteria bacterium]|nr:YhdH/YhfP family quinone oxidoreductase [Gammaproteobacteria bacterium]MXW08148.1 YhdH/YhfP family quinone oxidoreductase [Gammaproteobacteria bacterium]MYC26308.1 YhdH/YhfP family quinone oxidoreductase [Gammaproteobacteria bacterium]